MPTNTASAAARLGEGETRAESRKKKMRINGSPAR